MTTAPISSLQHLLWTQQRSKNLIWAIVGATIGFTILLLALQLYVDFRHLTQGNQGDDAYVIINKKVSIFNTLGGRASFSEAEISAVENQPFVQAVGRFNSNKFKVGAASERFGFYTELFFESLPNDFLDVQSPAFHWERGGELIPIILPRNYLALYNYGFAPSQGLPQFTPTTIQRVSMDVIIRGRGQRKNYQGSIVGFSDRINTILVPESFLTYANDVYGDQPEKGISRVMLKVDNPYAQEFQTYLKENNFELSTGKLVGGQVDLMVKMVLGILALFGLLIFFLALLLFILSFQLIISKSKQRISLLLQLGYTQGSIRSIYNARFKQAFIIVVLIAFSLLIGARLGFNWWISSQGFSIPVFPHWLVLVAGLIFAGFIYTLNIRNIKKAVHEQS